MKAPSRGNLRGAPRGRSLVLELARLVRPWSGLLVLAGVCVVASAVAQLAPPLVIRHVIDQNLVPRRSDGLLRAGILYLGAIAAGALFTFVYSYLAGLVAQRALVDLRVRLFGHLVRLPVTFFDRTPIGDVISRSTADVETIDNLFTTGIVTLVAQLVPLIAVVVAMIALSPELSLVAAVVAPPLVMISRFLQVRVRSAE